MPSLRRFAAIAPRYPRRFGMRAGIDILGRTILAKLLPEGSRVRVRVPGLIAPIEIRARTSDVKVFHQVFVDCEHEVRHWTSQMPEQVRTVLDAGANVGYSAISFASQFPDAQVIALEPDPSNYAQMVRNTRGYPHIVPVNGALWSAPCALRITNAQAEEWAFQVAPSVG